ncbi:MAG: hypothetical protein ACM359_09485 [Bacillota bacterium]
MAARSRSQADGPTLFPMEEPGEVTQETQNLRDPKVPTSEPPGEDGSSVQFDLGSIQWFRQLLALPLERAVAEARQFQIERRQQPGEEGRHHTPLFWFVWPLKGHPELEHLGAKAAWVQVDAIVEGWPCKRRKTFDAWAHWLDLARVDAQAEFMGVWRGIRFLPGQAPLPIALEKAREMPLRLKPEILDQRPDGYAFFISVAGWLQVSMGEQNILLPCRRLAKNLGVSEMTISRYRRDALKDGYVRQIKEHVFRSRGESESTEFQFDLARFPGLRDEAAPRTDEVSGE